MTVSPEQVAVVVPTCRPDVLVGWAEAWRETLKRHARHVLIVRDGETPELSVRGETPSTPPTVFKPADILGQDADLIYHHTDACRNLGFAYIAKHLPDVQVIITLDDDTLPDVNAAGLDPIAAHLSVLGMSASVSVLNSCLPPAPPMRGFPYNARDEARVVVSHGVWRGVPDLDAPTQLQRPDLVGEFDGPFYVGPVPRHCLLPFCGMNVAFLREMLPWMYYAPMGPRVGVHRYADIFLGIWLKKRLDATMPPLAMYSGASVVRHERASDVWVNLEREAKALKILEHLWRGADGNRYGDADTDAYVQVWIHERLRWVRWCEHAMKQDTPTPTKVRPVWYYVHICNYCHRSYHGPCCPDEQCPGYDNTLLKAVADGETV